MTFVHKENEGEKAECREIEAAARQRGGLYFPVLLTCDIEENRRRIVSPERSLNLKCVDPSEPDRRHKGPPLIRFDDHPNRIQMDVTHMQPVEAASMMLQVVSPVARAVATTAVRRPVRAEHH